MVGKGREFVERAARLRATEIVRGFNNAASTAKSQWDYGCLNNDQTKLILSDGSEVDVHFSGRPPKCGPCMRLPDGSYLLIGQQVRMLHTDASSENPYVVYFNSGSLYMTKGKDAPYPLDPALIPSGINGNPLPVFCNETQALLVYGFSFVSTFVLNLKWGILTNFKLSGGVWTGTIATGNITVDFSGIPQPSHPGLIPQDPLGKYPPPIETGSNLTIGFNSLFDTNALPQTLFWKDSSGDFHFGVCGAYSIDYQSTQTALNDGTHSQFIMDNIHSGRFLIDINQRTSASSLSYVQELSSIAFCTWTVIGLAVILSDPAYTVSGYLSGTMSSIPPEPNTSFFRSKAGIFAAGLKTLNTFFDPNNHWCSPWNAPLPASVEPNTPWVTFSDTEYLTDGAAFGSPAQVKALDSESFLAVSFGSTSFLQKYKGPTITSGTKYSITDPGPAYTLIGYGSYMVY